MLMQVVVANRDVRMLLQVVVANRDVKMLMLVVEVKCITETLQCYCRW